MQTRNILNAHRYVEDPMVHVYENQFERSKASSWFLNVDLLDGFSPGEIMLTRQLSKEKIEAIKTQLNNQEKLTSQETFIEIKKATDKAK